MHGFGFKIILECECGRRDVDSGPRVKKEYKINRRIIFVMRLLGVGYQGLNMFSGLMDFVATFSKRVYYSCFENISIASASVYENELKKASMEETELNDGSNEITVSGDGTWKKHGFSSLFGVATLIGKDSKKVIDACVKYSYCQLCNSWTLKLSGADLED